MSYSWTNSIDDTELTGAMETVTAGQLPAYTLTVTNADGATGSDSVEITLGSGPLRIALLEIDAVVMGISVLV